MEPSGGVSGEAAAAIAGASAVAGGLIGSLAGGYVDFLLGRSKEKRDARVGARLVRLDFKYACIRIAQIGEGTKSWRPYFVVHMEAWEKHRTSMSARLNPDDYETVANAVALLVQVEGSMEAAKPKDDKPLGINLSNDDKAKLVAVRTQVTEAFNTLSKLAKGHEMKGELLGDKGFLADWEETPD